MVDLSRHPYDRPMHEQRTVRVLAVIAGVEALAIALQHAPVGVTIHPLIPYLAHVAGFVASAVGLAIRGKDTHAVRLATGQHKAQRSVAKPDTVTTRKGGKL